MVSVDEADVITFCKADDLGSKTEDLTSGFVADCQVFCWQHGTRTVNE